MLRRIPRGITSGYLRVVADNRYLYDPVWNRAVDAAVSGRYVQTGICRSGCKGTVGRILCKHDDCLVFCDSACEAVGYGDSISGRTETGSLVHQKTIQKAVESFRITSEQKVYLKSLRYPRK